MTKVERLLTFADVELEKQAEATKKAARPNPSAVQPEIAVTATEIEPEAKALDETSHDWLYAVAHHEPGKGETGLYLLLMVIIMGFLTSAASNIDAKVYTPDVQTDCFPGQKYQGTEITIGQGYHMVQTMTPAQRDFLRIYFTRNPHDTLEGFEAALRTGLIIRGLTLITNPDCTFSIGVNDHNPQVTPRPNV